MLTPKAQLNLKNAKSYFREHLSIGDYYAEGEKVRGLWFGQGTEKLGLKGVIGERDFLRLCEGLHPESGERLTARRNSTRRENGEVVANRRVFYDFTFAPPKSVSVVALLHDERIVGVHNQAVVVAMRELERYAQTRVRRSGQDAERITGNIIAAAFRHETSRESDPHLHTHCVVLNATFDPEERRWKALQAVGMYRAQTFAENLYFHELAKGLHRLGYVTERTRHNFEIKGVPVSVLEKFSKRHQHIETEARRRLGRGEIRGTVQDAREQIARDLRKRKAAVTTAVRLRVDWLGQMDAKERESLRRLLKQSSEGGAQLSVAELVTWADEHLFERRAVVGESEIAAAALERGRGMEFDVAALRAEIARRDYVREGGSTKLTSREALRCELALVFAARDGRWSHAPLAPEFRPSAKLSPDQERAVRSILGSRDLMTIFRGGAGTGKSFALQEVARGLRLAGHTVATVAPQCQQVEDLNRDGLPAQTVAQLLATRQLPPRAVLIVDEAGQIGGRQMRDLVALVQAQQGRLILSGDTRQHGAVAASDALRAIEAYGRVTTAEIEMIRRQDPARGRSWNERTAIARYRAAVKAAAAGELDASFRLLDRLGCIREMPEPDRRAALAAEYLSAQARKESALVVAQTWAEVRAVNETIRDQLVTAGALGRSTSVESYQAIDATVAQRRDPRFYQPGQRAYFIQRYGRFTKGELCLIEGTNARGIVLLKNGRRSTMSFRYAERIGVTAPTVLPLAKGDRLQLKFNGRSVEGRPLNNGELVTVETLRRNGEIVVSAADGRTKSLAPTQRIFNRGYAVTSYASQGKTVDTVIFADAGSRAATSANQWYVTISRGRKRVVVFTSDKEALRLAVQHSAARPLALEIKHEPAASAPRRRLPAWVTRARQVIDTLHRIEFLQRCRAATAPRTDIASTRTPGVRHRL